MCLLIHLEYSIPCLWDSRNPEMIAEDYPVPDDCVSLLIGRGGATIERLHNESECFIQIATDRQPGSSERVCKIKGTPSAVQKAKKLIDEIVSDAQPREETVDDRSLQNSWFDNCSHVEGVLLDISGVLYDSGEGGGIPIQGSIEAVQRLKSSGLKVRFCTNETQCTTKHIVDKLSRLGFDIKLNELFSPAPAACQLLREKSKEKQLKPYLLVHPDAVPNFAEFDVSEPHNCVVIGDAANSFTYDNMNKAFRVLIEQEQPLLISMGRGRYYKETHGLMLDVGPFKTALEYAVDCKAEVVGKPAPGFFLGALKDMGVKPENAIMVGDDIVNDVGGAQACGIIGLQVRTGKFRPSDEQHATVKPDGFVDNLAQAVELLLTHRSK